METWTTLHPRRILHAVAAISVHGSVLPYESRTRALRFKYSRLFISLSSFLIECFEFSLTETV